MALTRRPRGRRSDGAGNGDAFVRILLELVAQCTDGDAEDVGGVRPVAEAMAQRVDDEIALDIGDGPRDKTFASLRSRRRRRAPKCRSRARRSSTGDPSGRRIEEISISPPSRQKNGAVHRVLEFAHVAARHS